MLNVGTTPAAERKGAHETIHYAMFCKKKNKDYSDVPTIAARLDL